MRVLIAGLLLAGMLTAQTPVGAQPRAKVTLPPEAFQLLIVRLATPEYPVEAEQHDIRGDVLLAVQLNQRGTLDDVKVIKGPRALGAAAIKAVIQSSFRPYLDRSGVAVPVRSEVLIRFPRL